MGFTGRSTTGPQQHVWAGETRQCSPEAGFVHKGEKSYRERLPCFETLSAQCLLQGASPAGGGWAGGWAGSLPSSGGMELEVLPGNVALEASQA